MGYIYRIVNRANGRSYVGSASRSIRKRWGDHVRDLRNGDHHSRYLQRAWDKYGESSFYVEEVEGGVAPDLLLQREQYHLDNTRETYNVCRVAGNCAGRKATTASRLKMSRSHKGIRRPAASTQKQVDTWVSRYGKAYDLRGPDGVVHTIQNMRAFSRQMGLVPSALRLVAIGKMNNHRGWHRPDCPPTTYIATSPNGQVISGIPDLKAFCGARALNYRCMHKVLQGQARTHRGWTVRTVDNQRKRKGKVPTDQPSRLV